MGRGRNPPHPHQEEEEEVSEFQAQDRFKLKYMEQVEFLRFLERLEETEMKIKQVEIHLDFLKRGAEFCRQELKTLLGK